MKEKINKKNVKKIEELEKRINAKTGPKPKKTNIDKI